MGNSLVLLGVATILTILMMPVAGQTQKQADPELAGMTLKGCLRADPANPSNADDKRVIYTLEVAPNCSTERARATGTSGQAQTGEQPKRKVQLSADAAKGLAKHVGREVQVTGELLQPPAVAPWATGQATPLPDKPKGPSAFLR